MKTNGFWGKRLRCVAYSVLRHTPRLRMAVRKIFWSVQKQKYEAVARSMKADPKIIFFEAYGGRSYACSPKALYLALIKDRRFDNYKMVWSFKDEATCAKHSDLRRSILVRRGSAEYFEALASAGVIIVNNRIPEYVYPKKDQLYIQCWHGTPLKRLGYDVEPEMYGALNTAGELADRFGVDAQKWTYLLSPSSYASTHLADAFALPLSRRSSVILEEGYPRNDVLVRARGNESERDHMRCLLNIPPHVKVLLYAPTWRDNSFQSGVGYTFEDLLDFEQMKKQLSNEWVILFRPHYYIANRFDFSSYQGFVIDVSTVEDINELFIASDALLTDYSSVIFDYANLRKPLILFVPDLVQYADSVRGFYFDLNEIPAPLCITTKEVLEAIEQLPWYEQCYGSQYDLFAQQFCLCDDGFASRRVLDRVFQASNADTLG